MVHNDNSLNDIVNNNINWQSLDKKICGLFGASVIISQYNNYGSCACLGCIGNKCTICDRYQSLLKTLYIDTIQCEKCMNCKIR